MQPKGFTSVTGTFLQQPHPASAGLQMRPRDFACAAAMVLQQAAAVLSLERMQAVHGPMEHDGMQGQKQHQSGSGSSCTGSNTGVQASLAATLPALCQEKAQVC